MNFVNKIFCTLLMLANYQAHGMFKAGRLLHKPTMPAAIPEQATLHLKQETKKSLDYQKKLYKAPTVHLVEAFSLSSPILMRYISLLNERYPELKHVLEILWYVNYYIKHSLEQCKTFLSNGIEFHTNFACSFVTPTYRTIAKYAHTKKQEQDRHSLIHEQTSKLMRKQITPYASTSDMIVHMIQTEAKHHGYESFFHGANGNLAILFELQKKLYAIYHNDGKIPTDFEFLRARKGREHLIGVPREEYLKQDIHDHHDSHRENLLAVGYFIGNYIPGESPLYFYSHNSSVCFRLYNLYKFIAEELDAYNLPMPTNLEYPHINNGLFLHILIKKPLADRLVYNSQPYGRPHYHSIKLPNQTDPQRLIGQARIILDPTVFDQPNDDIKIYRHQQLTEQEKQAIDRFCDELIIKAEELKKSNADFEYFKTHIMTTE